MVSRTKYLLDDDTVKRLFKKAGITGVTGIAPLGAGEYNAVYAVKADKEYVLKVAPAEDVPVLTYEKNMMQSEVYWYNLLRTQTDIRVPEVYFEDVSKTVIPTPYFIMEKIEGEQMDKFRMTDSEKETCARRVAQMVAQLHKIQNPKFGYIQNGLYDNWYGALTGMLENLICDAARVGKKSPKGEKLLRLAQTGKLKSHGLTPNEAFGGTVFLILSVWNSRNRCRRKNCPSALITKRAIILLPAAARNAFGLPLPRALWG